jgi:alcohol dehydrogenase (cytochrome c)
MFVTTPRNQVYALDARDGRADLALPARAPGEPGRRSTTPTAAWRSGATRSTRPRWTRASWPSMRARAGWPGTRAVADNASGYYMTMAPLAADGRIMVGVSGGELGIRGFVEALDARDRRARSGGPHDPRAGRARQRHLARRLLAHGRRARLGHGHYDPELNLTYWGTGNPGPGWATPAPGDNLYTNSVLALDLETGAHPRLSPVPLERLVGLGRGLDAPPHAGPERTDDLPGARPPGPERLPLAARAPPDGISFVDAVEYVYQDVFTSIDPETGRPSYDPAHKPGTGFATPVLPVALGRQGLAAGRLQSADTGSCTSRRTRTSAASSRAGGRVPARQLVHGREHGPHGTRGRRRTSARSRHGT